MVVVEPDIIGTGDRPPRRRPGWALPAAALAAAGLAAVVVIGSNARQPPRPAPPTPSPAPTAVPNDFDLLAEGGPCVAGAFRDGRLTYVFGLVNISSQPVEVLSVSRKAAGVALIATRLPTRCDTDRAAPAFAPFRLDPGKSRLLLLAYRVTDCAAARSAGPTPVTVMAGGRNGPTRSGLIDLPSSVSGPCT